MRWLLESHLPTAGRVDRVEPRRRALAQPLPGVASQGLERWQFRQIAQRGFGDPLNSYPHTMEWFKGHVYVGTMRASLPLLKARVPVAMQPWPVRCDRNVYDLDLRAQIWRYEPRLGTWHRAYIAPVIKGR